MGDIEHPHKKNEKKSRRKIHERSGVSHPVNGLDRCNLVVADVLESVPCDSLPSSIAIGLGKNRIFEFDITWSPPEFGNSALAIRMYRKGPSHISGISAVCRPGRTRVHRTQFLPKEV